MKEANLVVFLRGLYVIILFGISLSRKEVNFVLNSIKEIIIATVAGIIIAIFTHWLDRKD